MKKNSKMFQQASTIVIAVFIMMLIGLSFVLSGCGFSVGNVDKQESYASLFPDRAAEMGSTYKSSEVGYQFKLDDGSGEMMVYVDTSEGHQFEVVKQPAGFKIKDADGNEVLYAVCMEKEQFASYTASCTEVKTINGREFLYRYNEGDGSEDCFSYMADCGLDYGLALEVHDGNSDCFRLVAFRGDAMEGASTNVRDYQGEATEDDIVVEDIDDTIGDVTETTDEVLTESVSLSSDVKSVLDSLDTDYNRIYWGAQYSLSEDMPGIVVSVTPCRSYGEYMLVVAITNLYNEDVYFSGDAAAKDADDNVLGETTVFNSAIGSGNTIISTIDCGDTLPDGRITWTNVSVDNPLDEYVIWEADTQAHGDFSDGYITIDYDLYAPNKEAFNSDIVTFLLLDDDGFVVGIGTDLADEVGAGETYSGSVDVWGDEEDLSQTKGIAMFANPYIVKE